MGLMVTGAGSQLDVTLKLSPLRMHRLALRTRMLQFWEIQTRCMLRTHSLVSGLTSVSTYFTFTSALTVVYDSCLVLSVKRPVLAQPR